MISGTEVLTGWEAALSLFPSDLVPTNTAKIIQAEKQVGNDYSVAIDNYGFPCPATTSNPLYCIGILMDATGTQKVYQHTVDPNEWSESTIDMDFGAIDLSGAVKSGFYLCDKAQMLCSNIFLS
jgi:hypothetical protein